MAKAKAALAPKKGAAKKPAPSPLAKPGKKGYTKGQLIAHLATAVSGHGLGDVSKKQAAAFVEELTNTLFNFAPVGAVLPGLGKLAIEPGFSGAFAAERAVDCAGELDVAHRQL